MIHKTSKKKKKKNQNKTKDYKNSKITFNKIHSLFTKSVFRQMIDQFELELQLILKCHQIQPTPISNTNHYFQQNNERTQ